MSGLMELSFQWGDMDNYKYTIKQSMEDDEFMDKNKAGKRDREC